MQTALREAKEEIDLDPALVDVIATLPSATPRRRNLQVTPFVGLLAGSPHWLETHRRLALSLPCQSIIF